ncbi:serine hydrolase [Phenylobacterium sp. SCN 70-31]|uniref:serine hydrolase domain-containing protein n=1 Tax=Phenylobacterium sp. SCN 70-31 TaxID=1660129 RepID=UPI000868D03C|nr:serine hydrolase [Phenylobacterium sp. SCN 70-31]ODT89922.1 MAG: serine hydrolase [Phenylobacterium sp. SCN 70-31]
MPLLCGLACAAVLAGGVETAPAPEVSDMRSWTPQQRALAFRSVEKMFPVADVKRGERVRPLPVADRQIAPTFTYGGQSHDVASFMAAQDVSGLLVLQDGRIVLERYGLGRGPDDRWTSFSVAKSVTSILMGAAIADGRVAGLDAEVTEYVPEMKGSGYDGVTVRQLLTMTSGVRWNEDYTDPNADVARVGAAVTEPGVNPVVSYMRKLPRAHTLGEAFTYNTGETDLAGVVVSRAVGKPLARYLSEKIWAPYGMEQDAIWLLDAGGHERGGCCMSMTLRDYARIGQFMLDGGVAGGQAVLPAGWIGEATGALVRTDQPEREAYGYFWWAQGDGSFAAIGIHGQAIIVYPAERLVVAMNAAWKDARSEDRYRERDAFVQAVRAALR